MEERIDCYADKAKWKEEQPDNRKEDECKQRQWPADDEQD
jgi:hypothetical protein